jgi:hypothetical protein
MGGYANWRHWLARWERRGFCLETAQRDIASIKQEIADMREEQKTAQGDNDALIGLAKRLEDIAARLESA